MPPRLPAVTACAVLLGVHPGAASALDRVAGEGVPVVPPDTAMITEEASAPGDEEPERELRVPRAPVTWSPRVTSSVEVARTRGEEGVLQVVSAAIEPSLPGGLQARIELLAKWGHDGLPFPSEQGLSSLDAHDFGGPGEFWLEWSAAHRVRVKAGRVDANAEFAASEAAAAFVNPSFGLSPALARLPSYPDPAPSLNLFLASGPGVPEVGAGLYRAPGGLWTAVGQLTGAVPGVAALRWSAGVASSLGVAGPGAAAGGAWLIVERPSETGVAPFVVVAGGGEPGLRHLATGLSAPLAWGPDLRVGVAASSVRDGGGVREAVAEGFVTLRPVPWLQLQPDLQLRFREGNRPGVGGVLRVVVER